MTMNDWVIRGALGGRCPRHALRLSVVAAQADASGDATRVPLHHTLSKLRVVAQELHLIVLCNFRRQAIIAMCGMAACFFALAWSLWFAVPLVVFLVHAEVTWAVRPAAITAAQQDPEDSDTLETAQVLADPPCTLCVELC
jgi:hypothetical protein